MMPHSSSNPPKRPAATRILGVLATLAAALATLPSSPAAAVEPTSRIVYGGRVEDGQGRPIGGIYPLTFSFFRTEKGGRAVWTEVHFVAVDNGVYAIELGREKTFPKSLDLEKSYLSVAITGGKEIVREKFRQDPALVPATETPSTPTARPEPTVGAPPQQAKGSYADLAGFAYEAEKSKNSDAIGGMSVTDLRNLVKQSLPDPAKDTGSKVKIGDAKRYTEQAGGLGGQPFTLQCPPGFVVTGIRGQAAGYVDQISLICSPLE